MANNGTGPQIQRREVWVDLPPEYEGFQVKAWINAPARLWQQMDSGDEALILEAVQTIVREHNGWRDYDGDEYPQPTAAEFWEEIPNELMACILVVVGLAGQNLPKSLVPQKRRKSRAS
jgi:hypothetical protein